MTAFHYRGEPGPRRRAAQERWSRVDGALDLLLQRPSSAWPELVEEVCAGDPELAEELHSLLRRESEIEGFLEALPVLTTAGGGSALPELSPVLEGRRLARYRVVEEIARGGMGWVYLAEDTQLGRLVALKVLPPCLARDAGRLARFQREARIVASLNHPNIVTIHSFEEAEDIRFLTMELVEGTPLDRLLERGPLHVERFLHVAVPLTDAVRAAHELGIVHRDLKPANVMLTERGHVKVLDFGVAKFRNADTGGRWALEAAAVELDLTGTSAVPGTVRYMSPEQLDGRPVDYRSDLFSLGILFYETLTGERPFRGEQAADVRLAIAHEKPAGVRTLQPEVPESLERIVERCLEKQPERRFQSAADLLSALGAVRNGSYGKRSPGVTPPRMEAHEYFLRGRKFFYRISRRSFGFARQLYERAIELNPDYALAHSALADCCAFLSRYSGGGEPDLRRADEASRRALEIDPELAAAHASRGLVLSLQGGFDEAEDRFEAALALDPGLYEAHYFYARDRQAQGRYVEAARLFERAAELRSGDFEASRLLLKALAGMRAPAPRIEAATRRALRRVEHQMELNPDDVRPYSFGAPCLLLLGEKERALDWAAWAEELEPGEPVLLYNRACLLSLAGDGEGAGRTLESAVRAGFIHRDWIERDPELEPVRSDPRWRRLIMGLAPETNPCPLANASVVSEG